MKLYLLVIQLTIVSAAWAVTNLPCGIEVSFSYSTGATFGANLVWTLMLQNKTNVTRVCTVTMDADALAYNGVHYGDLATQYTTNTIDPNATSIVSLVVQPGAYTNWTGMTKTFELSACINVVGTSDRWIDIGRIVMGAATNILSVAPTPPVQQGQCLTGTVSYVNPLPMSLHNVKVSMTADEGLSTNATITAGSWNIGTVASNALISVSTNYTASQIGMHYISAIITADELDEVNGSVQVDVESQ